MARIEQILGKVSITTEGLHDFKKSYRRLCVVYTQQYGKVVATYISKKDVPAEIKITDIEYWQPLVEGLNLGSILDIDITGTAEHAINSDHANTARKDDSQNIITTTYIKNIELNGSKVIITRGDNRTEELIFDYNNDVKINGYANSVEELPINKNEGTIYLVGIEAPYRMYIYVNDIWHDNGEFNSLPAGIVQEKGYAENVVMSQKAVTEQIERIQTRITNWNETTATIKPNILNIWDKVQNLIISFEKETDILNEYMIQFVCGSENFTLEFNGENIKWAEEPDWVINNTYQISIVNNLAIYAEWEVDDE